MSEDKLYHYRVIELVELYDGDSFTLRVDVGFHLYTVIKVRLLGADTYELRGGTDETKELAKKGKGLALSYFRHREEYEIPTYVRTEKTDSFGRWLGEITDDEGYSLAQQLIDAGLTTGRYEEGK